MNIFRRFKPLLVLGMLSVLVFDNLQSAAQEIANVRQIPHTDGLFFIDWDNRFDGIKRDLPFSEGVVGYASDWDVPGVEYNLADAGAEHILTQYSVAPIVITLDSGQEWTIANMSPKVFEDWTALQEGDFTVTRYKKNLYLIHRSK